MYEVVITESYEKIAKKWLKKHQDLQSKYINTLQLLSLNPSHNSLRLHKIKTPLADIYSVSINMQYRIILEFVIVDNQIILLDVGDHDIYRN